MVVRGVTGCGVDCDRYDESIKFLPCDIYLHIYWAGLYLQWTGNLPEALRLQHEQHVHLRAQLSKPTPQQSVIFCGFLALHSASTCWTDSPVDMEDCVVLSSVRSHRHTYITKYPNTITHHLRVDR